MRLSAALNRNARAASKKRIRSTSSFDAPASVYINGPLWGAFEGSRALGIQLRRLVDDPAVVDLDDPIGAGDQQRIVGRDDRGEASRARAGRLMGQEIPVIVIEGYA